MDETDTAKIVYSNMESPLGIGSFKFIIKDSQPMVMTPDTHLFLTKEKAIYCKKICQDHENQLTHSNNI